MEPRTQSLLASRLLVLPSGRLERIGPPAGILVLKWLAGRRFGLMITVPGAPPCKEELLPSGEMTIGADACAGASGGIRKA